MGENSYSQEDTDFVNDDQSENKNKEHESEVNEDDQSENEEKDKETKSIDTKNVQSEDEETESAEDEDDDCCGCEVSYERLRESVKFITMIASICRTFQDKPLYERGEKFLWTDYLCDLSYEFEQDLTRLKSLKENITGGIYYERQKIYESMMKLMKGKWRNCKEKLKLFNHKGPITEKEKETIQSTAHRILGYCESLHNM